MIGFMIEGDMIKHFSAGGILVNSRNQVYLIHKIPRDEWALPKGTIREGEDRLVAATREVKEETGYVNVAPVSEEVVGEDHYVMEHPKTGEQVDKTVYYFLFRLVDSKCDKTQEMIEEELEGKWFEFDEAIDKVSFDKTKQLLKKVKNGLSAKS